MSPMYMLGRSRTCSRSLRCFDLLGAVFAFDLAILGHVGGGCGRIVAGESLGLLRFVCHLSYLDS